VGASSCRNICRATARRSSSITGDGYYTIYGYCSNLAAASGAQIEAGQVIAHVGDTDSVKGPALHFEIRHGKEALDPQGWLQR